MSNIIESAVETGYHEAVSFFSKIPLSHITDVVKALPAFIAQAEAEVPKIADAITYGATKMEYVLNLALPLIPPPYGTYASQAIRALAELQIIVSKIEGSLPSSPAA